MAKHTLTSQLVTTRSFSPNTGNREVDAPAQALRPAEQSLNELVSREEQELKRESIAQSWAEVRRRRGEVLVDIDRAIQVLEKRRSEAEEMLRTLSHRRQAVAAIDVEQPEEPGLDQLRRMKQDLHDAHVELTVFQRLDTGGSGAHRMQLTDLGLADLTRVGFGLLWPVVAGMVLAAVVLAVVLRVLLAT
jgi:hypothetical protein